MHVFIAGANGQIGRFLLQGIADSRHEARALVRHADQGPELQQLGATETVIGDLEQDCSEAMRGCCPVSSISGSARAHRPMANTPRITLSHSAIRTDRRTGLNAGPRAPSSAAMIGATAPVRLCNDHSSKPKMATVSEDAASSSVPSRAMNITSMA